jgi:hypothetical protein
MGICQIFVFRHQQALHKDHREDIGKIAELLLAEPGREAARSCKTWGRRPHFRAHSGNTTQRYLGHAIRIARQCRCQDERCSGEQQCVRDVI